VLGGIVGERTPVHHPQPQVKAMSGWPRA